jgi:hypothetical protein
MNSLTILYWYKVLKIHYQFTIFQTVRYALWLTR